MNKTGSVMDEASAPKNMGYRFSVVMKYYSRISLISYLVYLAIFCAMELWQMALICVICAALWEMIILINRKECRHVCFIAGIAITTLFSLLSTCFLGWTSGFFYPVMMIFPLIFLDPRMRTAVKVSIALIIGVTVVLINILSWGLVPVWELTRTTLQLLYGLNLIFTVIILSITGHYFEAAAADTERALILANKKLTGLATTDPVTNLVNRRTMMMRIEQERERMERGGKTFVLVMVDVDNFKMVNDEYGHDAGDFVLVSLAEMINISLRKQDEVARWGGDEFLILLPETDSEGGLIVAEKIRSRIVRSPFVYHELDIPVSVTFGVGLCDANIGIGSCIRKADMALYQAKQAGKNRVGLIR